MDITITPPVKQGLLKKIEFFYQYSNKSGRNQYYTYPNNHCFWTVAFNTKKTYRKNVVYLEEDKGVGLNQIYVGPISNRIRVVYKGEVNVLSVCFKPLHIHSFLDKGLSLQDNQLIFNTPEQSLLPNDLTMTVLEDDGPDKFLKLEQFLLSKFNQFNKPLLEEAIHLIESYPEYRIEDIAKRLNISVKSLTSNFKKYLGRTPLEYRRVHKFRKALSNQGKKLTEICYDSNYFDQSHMIKDFHKYGKQSPKEIKQRKNLSGTSNILWLKA